MDIKLHQFKYQGRLAQSLYLFSAAYLRLQWYFTQVNPRERRTGKIWKFGNYFLPCQTHLSFVILTADILFKVIVLLRKLLGKNNKIRESDASFFAMKHATFSMRCYFQGGLYRQVDMQVESFLVYQLIQAKIFQLFKIKDLKHFRKPGMVSILIRSDCFVCKSTGSGNSFAVVFHKDFH